MFKKQWAFFALIVFLGSMILTACGTETVEVTRVVTEKETIIQEKIETVIEKVIETVIQKETIIEEKLQTIVETVIETVVETVIVEVPAEVEEVAAAEVCAPDPETYTFISFGDPDTLDINLNYETSGGQVILNVAEGLIFYDFHTAVGHRSAQSGERRHLGGRVDLHIQHSRGCHVPQRQRPDAQRL
jgi:hypothetical protein